MLLMMSFLQLTQTHNNMILHLYSNGFILILNALLLCLVIFLLSVYFVILSNSQILNEIYCHRVFITFMKS
ncbi:unnamed protein product [Rotaria socialis]